MLDRGYARLTSFECPDTPAKIKQGFEWFGAAGQAHEALTAYGLLQFKDMARVHKVDPELIKRTQAFLLSRSDGSGGFKRNPRALDTFGGAPKHTTDAYIVWASSRAIRTTPRSWTSRRKSTRSRPKRSRKTHAAARTRTSSP